MTDKYDLFSLLHVSQTGVKCSFIDRNTDLSSLACQCRISECVAWRRSSNPAGTQETDAPGWEYARSHLELPLSAPPYNSAHRACCGEGVGPIGPAGVKKTNKEEEGASGINELREVLKLLNMKW